MIARLGVVVALLAGGGLVGCAAAAHEDLSTSCPPARTPQVDPGTVVIEGDPWSGYAAFRQADLMEGSGYEARYVEQVCQPARAVDLNAGRADIILTTLDQHLLYRPEGTIVGVVDVRLGGAALVLNNKQHAVLRGLDDLPRLVESYEEDGDAPVLAYAGDSPAETLLDGLETANDQLRLGDLELAVVDQSATAYQMLRDGDAQLAVLSEPQASVAVAAGYVVALDASDVPAPIVDVIVASDRLLEDDPAAVEAVVRSFYTTMDGHLAGEDREALAQAVATDGAISAVEARSIVNGIQWFGAAAADAFMNEAVFPLDRPLIEQSIEAVGALLALAHPTVELDGVAVDGRFVSELSSA